MRDQPGGHLRATTVSRQGGNYYFQSLIINSGAIVRTTARRRTVVESSAALSYTAVQKGALSEAWSVYGGVGSLHRRLLAFPLAASILRQSLPHRRVAKGALRFVSSRVQRGARSTSRPAPHHRVPIARRDHRTPANLHARHKPYVDIVSGSLPFLPLARRDRDTGVANPAPRADGRCWKLPWRPPFHGGIISAVASRRVFPLEIVW